MRWESLSEKKTRKKIEYFLVGCKARGLQKGGFGCVLAIKARKGKKKRQAERTGLTSLLREVTQPSSLIFAAADAATVGIVIVVASPLPLPSPFPPFFPLPLLVDCCMCPPPPLLIFAARRIRSCHCHHRHRLYLIAAIAVAAVCCCCCRR